MTFTFIYHFISLYLREMRRQCKMSILLTIMLEILKNIGFSEKEAQIYLAMLDFGQALPGTIADRAGVKRTTAYFTINELVKRGLASKIKIRGYYHYQPLNPHILLSKQHKVFSDLEQIIPKLITRQGRFNNEPQVTLHYGKEGVIHVMEDSLSSQGEICGWANVDEASTGYLKDYYPEYIRKKNQRGIWVRAILTEGPTGKQFQAKGKEELREAYLIPHRLFPFANEINIYDNTVFIISHKDKLAVLIKNKTIAETQRSIFKLSWLAAQQIDKEGSQFYASCLVPSERLLVDISGQLS